MYTGYKFLCVFVFVFVQWKRVCWVWGVSAVQCELSVQFTGCSGDYLTDCLPPPATQTSANSQADSPDI